MAKKHVAVSLRKPPSPEKLDAFVAAAAEAPAVNTSPRRRRRAGLAAPEILARSEAAAPVAEAQVAEAPIAEAAPEVQAPEPEAAEAAESGPVPPPVSGVQAADLEAAEAAPEEVSASASADVSEPEAAPEAAPAPEDVTPAAPGVAPAPAPAATIDPPVADASGRSLRPVTVYLPQPLAERLALHCIAQDRDASNVIGEALEQHLSRRLGAGTWSADSGEPAASGAHGFHGAGPFRWEDPRGWADAFRNHQRVERLLHIGRVIFGIWQKRPWAA